MILEPHVEARSVEVRIDEENQRLALVSVATLEYMHDYGLAHVLRLKAHGRNMRLAAEDEFDLLEAMRLSARLNRVAMNMGRAERRNELIRAELVRRELD